MKIDKIIVSSDLSPKFLNFWPLVSRSWNTVFSINPVLVIVSKTYISNSLREKLEPWGEVVNLVSRSKAPIQNQAKLARWFYASKCGSELVMLEDIDTVFLNKDYLLEKMEQFREGNILGIGSDVNQHDASYVGKFPVSNITGRGNLFADLFLNHKDNSFESFIDGFKGTRVIDEKEDPFNTPSKFSDESLIRAIRKKNSFTRMQIIPRNVNIHKMWLDRSWWPTEGYKVEPFILANLPRPLYENRRKVDYVMTHFFPEQRYPWIMKRRNSLLNYESKLFFFLQKAKLFLLSQSAILRLKKYINGT